MDVFCVDDEALKTGALEEIFWLEEGGGAVFSVVGFSVSVVFSGTVADAFGLETALAAAGALDAALEVFLRAIVSLQLAKEEGKD